MTLKAQAFSQIISFTRTSAATFVNSAGNIALTPASVNLLTFSQEFDNSAWVKTSTSVSANSFVAPDATTGADTITASGANGTALQSYTASATPYTFSIWLRRLTGSGNVQLTVDGTTYVTVAVTSDWTRFSTTLTPSAGTRSAGIRIVTSADAVYAWGAMLEAGSSPSAYVRNFGGLFPPRIDYDPVTLLPRGLLVEEQRTNLITYSEEIDNAAWAKNAATVTANAATSPDGTTNADKVVPNTTNTVHGAYRTQTYGAGTFTLSFYAKADGYPRVGVRSYDGTSYFMQVTFDVSAGTVVSAPAGTASIQAAGNGWYRCIVTATTAGNMGSVVGTWIEPLPAGQTVQASYAGDGTSGTLVYGAQLEAGSFATSYIPTVASQVTRSADVPTMTGTDFSSWFNGTAGTIYVEAEYYAGAGPNLGGFSANSGSVGGDNLIGIGTGSPSTNARSFIYNGTTTEFSNSVTGGGATGAVVKQAVAYATNDAVVCANGVLSAVDTAVTLPTGLNQARIGAGAAGGGVLSGYYRVIRFYPERLTNAQLQALTS